MNINAFYSSYQTDYIYIQIGQQCFPVLSILRSDQQFSKEFTLHTNVRETSSGSKSTYRNRNPGEPIKVGHACYSLGPFLVRNRL